ncbi:MAG: NADH-quinone oxidoreductase subunit L [Mycobacteriales bacterium]
MTIAAPAAAATGVFSLSWVLIALPLASALVLLVGGRRTNGFGHVLGVLAPSASFVLAVFEFAAMAGRAGADRAIDQHLFSWVPVAGFQVDAGLLLDPLSMAFVLLITGVGALIHLYSVGYMAHDPDRRRFFGYMNLFIAAMLLLVLGNSFLALYVGWEGVGLASYLLIGFWFYKPVAATAAKKAFIVNRIGDVGLSLAIMLMFATVGTTSFTGVFAAAPKISAGTATALALLLLLGAIGKSGQFPLQTWLPDAMEGPTPVSALIHAATMVTAGVYLIARAHPIFDVTSSGRTVVAIVGAVTLLIGCIIGSAYDDIKKVLAYSTVSQIGYMFLAVGLGGAGYAVGIFHLLTHGFFKATLFLGAGSVMHAMGDQVNIRRFGGLRTRMPVTFVAFICGYLAIIGFPFFAGFYSKDAIIETAYDKGGTSGWLLGTIALIGAGLTAYYMTRLVVLTFFGKPRWTDDVHPHESPLVMTVPMVVLAAGAVFSGYLLKEVFDLKGWLGPVLGTAPELGHHTVSPTVLTLITLLVVFGGALGAYLQYGRQPVSATMPVAVSPFTTAARHNLYADAFNESVLMRPGQYLTRALVYVDNRGVDGGVNGLAALVGGSSGRLRRLQTGFVRSYALSMFGGAALVVGALLLVRFT